MKNPDNFKSFMAGFQAMMPFWLGAIPFALTYVTLARQTGLSPLEIQLMSLAVFSSAVQVSVIGLLSAGASLWLIALTCLALTVQNVLYSLSLQQKLRLPLFKRLLAGSFLTDGAYALTVTAGEKGTFAYLMGTELGMFCVWNGSTLLSLLLSQGLTGVTQFNFDFVIPLMFAVVLAPMVRRRFDLLVVAVAALSAYLSSFFLPAGMVILVAGLAGATFGACFTPAPPLKPGSPNSIGALLAAPNGRFTSAPPSSPGSQPLNLPEENRP